MSSIGSQIDSDRRTTPASAAREPPPTMTVYLDETDAKAARRRREKPQLSCDLCRKRKLRCDRCHPCHNCSRRGLGDTCTFPDSTLPKPPLNGQDGPNVRDRVQQLESQVEFLMGALKQANMPPVVPDLGATPKSPAVEVERNAFNHDSATAIDTPGRFEMSSTQASYVGSAHWIAILQNIPELGEIFSQDSHIQANTVDGIAETDDNDMDLVGWHQKVNRQEILDALPPKDFADNLVAVCFTNTNTEAMIVHPPTFHKEYERFWAQPTSAPIMWVGMLFALMCLAVQYQQFSLDETKRRQIAESEPEKLIRLYREKTVQCLVLGKYHSGPRYAVEALLLYVFIECLRREHIQNLDGPWVQWGILVRIAFKAGYHRDGSHFPDISCFEAELRRRVWAMIVGWDLYLSMQFALPRMINPALCDTMEPRNLYDEDLHEHLVELPPPRPDSAQSFSQFHVAKNKILEIFAEANDMTMSVASPPSYSEVLRLDVLLSSTYDTVISVWQPASQQHENGSAAKSPAAVSVPCTFLTLLYHRAQMVLHRKYMSLGRVSQKYAYSRKVAVEAALTTLQHQWVLYLETQVGGQLCRHGWKFLVLLVRDFLFATAVLCAELAEEMSLLDSASLGDDSAGNDTRNRVFYGLSSAYMVWLNSNDSESSREVKLVVASLKHLLSMARRKGFGQGSIKSPTPPAHHQPIQDTNMTDGTEGMGGISSDASPPVLVPENERPRDVRVYWGLGHFPI